MKNLKRIIAAFAAMPMLLGNILIPSVMAENNAVVNVSFDSDSDTDYLLASGAELVSGRNGSVLMSQNVNTSYATFDATAINEIDGDFTFSIWCYPYDHNGWTRLYDIGTGVDKYIFLTPAVGGTAGYPRFAVKNGGYEESLTGTVMPNLNEWNNITVTRSGTLTTMYLNGFAIGSTTGITINPSDIGTTTNNYIIKSQYEADPYFNGMVDEFAVFDEALSESEVIALAAESYEKIVAKERAKKDRYFIDTNFYNADGEKIFAIESEPVIAKIEVENRMLADGSLTAVLYANEGGKKTVLATSDEVYIESSEGTTIELSAEVDDSVEFLSVTAFDSGTNQEFEIGYIGRSEVVFTNGDALENEYPGGSWRDPRFGAHDPAIFKDPKSGIYYAYSSHNLIFESEDLINWVKYDYTSSITIPDSAYDFITNSFADTEANTTYWAPDIMYNPDDEYPYYMYVSVSCGLGLRNSVISLVKSDSPLIWDGNCVDCGVVVASVESVDYKTNAIDAHIYTDTDGEKYFIWGSYWQGIAAAGLNDDGSISGIDFFADGSDTDENTQLLEASKNFGTTLIATQNGIYGPEGPWMFTNPDTGYRYLVTSYGWLSDTYNLRVARSSLDTSMADIIAGRGNFTDERGNNVSTAFSAGSATELWGYKMKGSYQLGSGMKFYGSGHNSVLNEGDEWYLVDHTRLNYEGGTAYLQVRKMLWTENGWPVVSPLGYTGEEVQKIDEMMLWGTWDVASVGKTIITGGVTDLNYASSANADLIVKSSEIVLMPDGKLAYDMGNWEFDGEHTVTVTFTKDGNEGDYEFYKSGDVLKMYVLVGYDEHEGENALVMTGVNQNTVAQFAKKASANAADLTSELQTTETVVEKSKGNPILGFDTDGNLMYAGDPAATVMGDTVYLYAGHDTATGDGYQIPEYVLYTSQDMVNWECKGTVLSCSDVSWASDVNSAWACQVTEYNGKYYLYFCTWAATDSGKQSIGVAVSDSPEGPFVDIGEPLVKGSVTTPQTSDWNDIDPTVLIDTDADGVERRYLAWGNGKYYICELNEDMISVTDQNSDGAIDMNDIRYREIQNLGSNGFTEAPWLYERNGKYYTFFAANWREEMAYAMADSPYGPWEFCGIIMPPTATSNTNHPSVIDFNGKTYFIYHNGALENGNGFRRSIAVEELKFDEDGYVIPLTETSVGISGTSRVLKTESGRYIAHAEFRNSRSDACYPIDSPLISINEEDEYNTAWEITAAKYNTEDETYVSIQSVNKPGLYISADADENIRLTTDDGTKAKYMTFKTVEALSGSQGSISLESVENPGRYLTVMGENIVLSNGRDVENTSFVLDEVSEITPSSPQPKPTETPLAGNYNNNFDNLAVSTLITTGITAQDPLTSVAGVSLLVGYRAGGDATSGFAIEEGGITGNVLVMNSGRFVSASRGPRFTLAAPEAIYGTTMTVTMMVKLSGDTAKLRYNNSTSTQTGTELTGLSATEWTKITVSRMTDMDGNTTRKMWVGDELIINDNLATMPVFWGTTTNSTYSKVYIDNLSYVTVKNPDYQITDVDGTTVEVYSSGNAAVIYAVTYDENGALKDVEMFNIVNVGTSSFEAEFEPERVFVWSYTQLPYSQWNK